MAWIGLAFFLLLIAPVRAGVNVRLDSGGLRGAVGVMLWGVRGQVHWNLVRSAEGAVRLTAAFRNRQLPLPRRKKKAGAGMKLLGLMLKNNGKNHILRKVIRVNAFDIQARLGGDDAAALALGAGLLRSLNGLLPVLRLRCVPVLGGRTEIALRCIAEARLGILLIAWLLARKREE